MVSYLTYAYFVLVAEKDSLILRRNTTQGLPTHSPRVLYRQVLAWR